MAHFWCIPYLTHLIQIISPLWEFIEVQCEVSTVSDDLGCRVICWCWSTVFSEVHSQRSHLPGPEHFMLPSADTLYGDADFIFQQDLAPAHTAKGTKSWFNDHSVTVLDWPANSPNLNPIENLDERHQTQHLKATVKETWASLHLTSVTGWSTSCHAALMQ